jgi:hypothetical protein
LDLSETNALWIKHTPKLKANFCSTFKEEILTSGSDNSFSKSSSVFFKLSKKLTPKLSGY